MVAKFTKPEMKDANRQWTLLVDSRSLTLMALAIILHELVLGRRFGTCLLGRTELVTLQILMSRVGGPMILHAVSMLT